MSKLLSTVLRAPAFAALAVLAACGGANSETGATPADKPAAASADGIKAGNDALSDMTLGSPDAPVLLIEYASTTCPHCASFHEGVFPTIKKDFIDTGKVRMVFREFPTSPANLSVAASMLARCAAEKAGSKDAYFHVLGSLFATQRTWILSETPRDELIKIASQAGMTEADFDACVGRKELLDFLNENITEARDKYDINSTPSFVVNGQVRHFSSVEEVTKSLNEAVAKAEADKASE
ncbi:MAG: DsbA family protein [Parvularculaceae bacterium]